MLIVYFFNLLFQLDQPHVLGLVVGQCAQLTPGPFNSELCVRLDVNILHVCVVFQERNPFRQMEITRDSYTYKQNQCDEVP